MVEPCERLSTYNSYFCYISTFELSNEVSQEWTMNLLFVAFPFLRIILEFVVSLGPAGYISRFNDHCRFP